jgi:LPS export ABC transporter permease LptG
VSLYRLSLPALAVALIVVALCAYLEAEVLPASNQRVAQIRDQIQGRETARTYRRVDRQWLFGQGRYVYNYLHFDPRRETLQRLQVFEFNDDYELARRLFTSSARYVSGRNQPGYEGGDWVWADGWARSFDGVENLQYIRFTDDRVVDYPETPEYFDTDVVPPEQMPFGELKRYIRDLQESGQSVPELEVQLHNKIAFPIVSLVMALVALPFAFRLGKQGALYGIGISVAVGIVFMGIHAFFTTLGEAGALPASLAVWSPSLVFALLSLYLFLGVRS